MFIVCYLAQDDRFASALRGRLALAKLPKALLLAHSVPELINQVQTLPINAVVADISWPRTIWTQIVNTLRATRPSLPILALSSNPTEHEWWHYADDLLRLDENPELFLYRIERIQQEQAATPPAHSEQSELHSPPTYAMEAWTTKVPGASSLLENAQFRQFAELFSCQNEAMMIETFVGWVQQICQTSRVVMLLRDPETGDFHCVAQRGLPSTLVPYCRFPQTASLCRWLTTGHILLREVGAMHIPADVLSGLDLMQATVAIPTMLDGQLVGILGIGPRLVGQGYSPTELEGLFALGGQMAMAQYHFRAHRRTRTQQELTEHMLRVMPTGTVVLGDDNNIVLVNEAAAAMLGVEPSALQGRDLRALPSPLGDMAYEAITKHCDHERRELILPITGHPVAVACSVLETVPPSAMLLIEDLSAHKQLQEEQERRLDLEVVTNLVHYLAHELRNPLVALSTFNQLVPTRAGEPDFQEFCESVLQAEIGRVNLLLEQLLVLTNHAEYQFDTVDLIPILEHITGTPEMRSGVVTAIPVALPLLFGDVRRLETALTCILRSIMRLSQVQTPVTMRVTVGGQEAIVMEVEATVKPDVTAEWLLNPWHQLLGEPDQQVDFGLATAQFIIEQHTGTLTVSVTGTLLTCQCRLPVRAGSFLGESQYDTKRKSARSR